MADRRDALSALLQPLVDDSAQRQAPSQYIDWYHSDWHRAVLGTWLLVAGVYTAHEVMARYDLDPLALVTALAGHPHGPASALAAPVIGFLTALVGCLWVVEGATRERAPHQAAGVFCLCVLIGGCTYALTAGVYLDDDPVASAYLQGFYLATLAASVMELFLYMRCAWDAPLHYVRRERMDGRAERSAAVALRRAQQAGVIRRRNRGFARPATSGIF
jgi:hypothetical protein